MDHLHPDVRCVAEMPISERLINLATDRWIGYSRAQEALRRMHMLMTTQVGRVRPQNMLIVGPSNNGKSTIAEKFQRQHPGGDCGSEPKFVSPVLTVQMPPFATIPRFYTSILRAIGSTRTELSTTSRPGSVELNFLRLCNVRLLIIDELHNLLCGPSPRQRELLGMIRYLGNELRIPIVGIGTKDAWLALRLDDQLENRFQPFLLPPWCDDDEAGRLLASFETVLPLRQPSGLGLPQMRKLIVDRSEGLIGEMHQFLASATAHALSNDRERIEVEDLMNCHFDSPSVRRQMLEKELRA